MDVWILFGMIGMAVLVTVYLGMRFGERDGRGHRGHNKSTQRYLDEVEQPERPWF